MADVRNTRVDTFVSTRVLRGKADPVALAHPKNPLGELIVRMAMMHGFTNATVLARAIGVSRQALDGWITKKEPQPTQANRDAIAAVLGVDRLLVDEHVLIGQGFHVTGVPPHVERLALLQARLDEENLKLIEAEVYRLLAQQSAERRVRRKSD